MSYPAFEWKLLGTGWWKGRIANWIWSTFQLNCNLCMERESALFEGNPFDWQRHPYGQSLAMLTHTVADHKSPAERRGWSKVVFGLFRHPFFHFIIILPTLYIGWRMLPKDATGGRPADQSITIRRTSSSTTWHATLFRLPRRLKFVEVKMNYTL